MQGQSVPTTTATQLNTSPLSAISTLGSLTAALNQTPQGGGNTPAQNISSWVSQLFGGSGSNNVNLGTTGQTSGGDSTGTMDYSGGVTVMPDSSSSTGWSVNGAPSDQNGNLV
jgi:hypothetical protein